MLKKLSVIGAMLAVVVIIALIKVLQIKALIAAPIPTEVQTISAAPAVKQEWVPTIEVVGSVAPVQGVTIAAELDGKVVGVSVNSGSHVKAGDLLVQQDISVETAQLRSAEAAADLAKVSLLRSRELLAKSTVSQSDYDSALAQYKQAVAQIDNIKSVIAKKTLRAPFDGTVGIRLVNLGQSLKAGDAIIPLQALEQVYVNFLVPQQRLQDLREGLKIEATSDSFPGELFSGVITAVDPLIDSATRNVKVQATFPNAQEHLKPGMFVGVRIFLPKADPVVVVPASAILYAPYGDSVFLVEEKKDPDTGKTGLVARQQFVKVGGSRGDFVSLVSGVKAGDTVVTTGVFKLRNGVAVTVDNSLAPTVQLAPKPNDS